MDMLRFSQQLLGVGVLFAMAPAIAQERVSGLEVVPVEWRNVGPGGGGWVPAICASRHSPDRLWVGCDVGGVFLSEDGGRHYQTLNAGLGNLFVKSICEHPTNADLVLIGSHGGIFKTTDRGRHWKDCRKGLPPISGGSWGVVVEEIVSVPGAQDSFWAVTGRTRVDGKMVGTSEIYRSDDAGESWRQVVADGAFPAKTSFTSLSPDPQNPDDLLVCASKGLFRSVDGGKNWERSEKGLPHLRVRYLARSGTNPNIVYVTLQHKSGEMPWQSQPYRSDDGGCTWQACGTVGLEKIIGEKGGNLGFTSSYDWIAVNPENSSEVYLCGATWRCEGVWKSMDAGRTWRHVFTKEMVAAGSGWLRTWGPDIHSLAISVHSPHAVTFGTAGYVYTSSDGGETWRQCYTDDSTPGTGASIGYETTCLHTIDADPVRRGRFFCNYMDIGLQITEDNGKSFVHAVRGASFDGMNDCYCVSVDPKNADHLWGIFGNWSGNRGHIAESLDSGRSWKSLTVKAFDGIRPAGLAVFGADAPYRLVTAVGKRGLVYSRDGGGLWEDYPTNRFSLARQVTRVSKNEGMLYVCVGATLYRAGHDGSFTRIFSEPIGSILDWKTSGSRILVCGRECWTGKKLLPGGVWLSLDDGATWKHIYKDPYVFTGLFADGYILACPYDNPYHDRDNGGGVVMTADDGKTWKTLNSPSLYNWNVTALTADPFDSRIIWAGTHGNSIFVTRLPDLKSEDVKTVLCWGDSITEGMAMGPKETYPARLQAMLGGKFRVLNSGDGGEDVATIPARQGCLELQTASKIVFPNGKKMIQVGNGEDNGFHASDGKKIKLTAALGREIPVNPVRIGDDEYKLSFTEFKWNTPTNPISYKLWLVRQDTTTEKEIETGTPVVFASTSAAKDAYCEIYLMGANGGWDNKIENLIASYRKMIARRGDDKPYLVIVPYWGGFSGSQAKAFKAAFGAHAVDFRGEALRRGLETEGLEATDLDKREMKRGHVPPSLLFNNRPDCHMNAHGYHFLARLVFERGRELGYW